MFEFLRSNKKASSRDQIAIRGIENGILILPRNEYRLILKTSSINFYLMSEGEQDVILDMYKAFLNSLTFPIQILQKVRTVDTTDYLQSFETSKEKEIDNIYKDQIQNYIHYVNSLIKTNKILTRQFYIVIPYYDKKNDINIVYEHLINRFVMVEKGLTRFGVRSSLLDSFELIDLFYSTYNTDDIKYQPFKQQMIDSLQRSHF